MKRGQDLDFTVVGKLARLHIVKLFLSPSRQGARLDFDRSLRRGLNEFKYLGSDMNVGRGRILSRVGRVEMDCLDR
jgi:hypothetical protein